MELSIGVCYVAVEIRSYYSEIDTKYFRWNDECQREPGYVPMGNFKKIGAVM